MSTIADALDYAADRLDAATRAMTAIRDQIAAQLAAATTNVTTIINEFQTKPNSSSFFVDPVNGDDANDGQAPTTALKTMDRVFGNIPRDAFITVYLLGDVAVTKFYHLAASVVIYGVQYIPASGVSPRLRRITFGDEALNSPVATVGRTVAGFAVLGPYLRYQYVDLMLGAPDPALDNKGHHITQGSVIQATGCNLNAPSAGSAAVLVTPLDGAQSSLWYSGSLGANAPGHIVAGRAAGGNPNTDYTFRTNLTSA